MLRRAVELTILLRSELTVLSVVKPGFAGNTTMGEEQGQLAGFHRELIFSHFPPNEVGVESTASSGSIYRYRGNGGMRIRSRVENGDPVERICAVAKEMAADLVIVGNRGLGEAGRFVLGSVSEKVVHKCPHSVLVVKGEGSDPSGWEMLSETQRARQHLGLTR